MDRDRSARLIAVVALCVAVVGLSVGFAAFSKDLVITSNATVTPDPSAFKMVFTNKENEASNGELPYTGSLSQLTGPTTNATGGTATITDTTITGVSADFTYPGQKVVYDFWAYNDGDLIAYLNGIDFGVASGGTGNIYCVPGQDADGNDTDADLVETACDYIKVTVNVGGIEATDTMTNDDITAHFVPDGESEPVQVVLEYVNPGEQADGPFTVNVGDITLNYGSVD